MMPKNNVAKLYPSELKEWLMVSSVVWLETSLNIVQDELYMWMEVGAFTSPNLDVLGSTFSRYQASGLYNYWHEDVPKYLQSPRVRAIRRDLRVEKWYWWFHTNRFYRNLTSFKNSLNRSAFLLAGFGLSAAFIIWFILFTFFEFEDKEKSA